MTEPTLSRRVAVLGSGFMGAAIAKVFARSGYEVKVWNRTFEKAEALRCNNIVPSQAIEDAVIDAGLIVGCVRSYDDLGLLVDKMDVSGKVLLNVTTGTSAQAHAMAQRVAAAGGGYLDGAIICYPDNLGTERGRILVSGEGKTWEETRELITALGGGVRWVGEEVFLANVVDSAVVGGFHISALVAFAEAANYALGQGVSSELFFDVVRGTLENIPDRLASVGAAIRDNNFNTDQATLATYANGMREFVQGIEADGFNVPLMRSARDILNDAETRGWGACSIAATVRD